MSNRSLAGSSLGSGSIPKLIMSFSGTILATLLLNSLYTLTDALFVSWGVGDDAMGGVSIAYPFVLLQGAIAAAIGSGAGSIVSRKLGEGKNEEAGKITRNARVFFYVLSALITVVGFIFMDPILRMMGTTDELYEFSKQYFSIILAGNVMSTGFSAIIRSEGNIRYAAMIWFVNVSINIVLDALFILVFHWGVIGSAVATVMSQAVTTIMSVIFFSCKSVQKFKGTKLSFKTVGQILMIGVPTLVQMGSISVMSVVLNNILGKAGGVDGITTFAYISKIMTFAIVPFTAITQALSPIVGYNYGAKKYDRIKKSIKFSVMISLIYAATAFLMCLCFPSLFIRIFTKSDALILSGSNGLRIVALSIVFAPFSMLAGSAFQAIGKMFPALVMYSANLLFLIPAVLIFPTFFGMNGVWWAYVLSYAAAAVFAMVIVLKTYKSKKLEEFNMT